MIRKRGRRWQVVAQSGRVLGSHTTKAAASKQLRAVEAAKGRRKRRKKRGKR